jgi:hypothetical protein
MMVGVVILDDKDKATIASGLIGALNMDFRYQLAAIGAPGPNLYIGGNI